MEAYKQRDSSWVYYKTLAASATDVTYDALSLDVRVCLVYEYFLSFLDSIRQTR